MNSWRIVYTTVMVLIAVFFSIGLISALVLANDAQYNVYRMRQNEMNRAILQSMENGEDFDITVPQPASASPIAVQLMRLFNPRPRQPSSSDASSPEMKISSNVIRLKNSITTEPSLLPPLKESMMFVFTENDVVLPEPSDLAENAYCLFVLFYENEVDPDLQAIELGHSEKWTVKGCVDNILVQQNQPASFMIFPTEKLICKIS